MTITITMSMTMTLELGNINDQYMFTGTSSTDSNSRILCGRPSGGTAILLKVTIQIYCSTQRKNTKKYLVLKLQ